MWHSAAARSTFPTFRMGFILSVHCARVCTVYTWEAPFRILLAAPIKIRHVVAAAEKWTARAAVLLQKRERTSVCSTTTTHTRGRNLTHTAGERDIFRGVAHKHNMCCCRQNNNNGVGEAATTEREREKISGGSRELGQSGEREVDICQDREGLEMADGAHTYRELLFLLFPPPLSLPPIST